MQIVGGNFATDRRIKYDKVKNEKKFNFDNSVFLVFDFL